MNNGSKLYKQVLGQCIHFGPVRNVGTHHKLNRRIRFAEAVINPSVVCRRIEFIFRYGAFVFNIRRRGNLSSVQRGCGNGTCIHQANARKLTLAGF